MSSTFERGKGHVNLLGRMLRGDGHANTARSFGDSRRPDGWSVDSIYEELLSKGESFFSLADENGQNRADGFGQAKPEASETCE